MLPLQQQFCGDTPASICASAQGFDTVFILMPENTFGVVTTFNKIQQNFAEMQAPEEYQVTLSKWSFLQPWWLNFPQWSIYTSYSLLWLILYGNKTVKVFFLMGNFVCSVPEMNGLVRTLL